MTGLQKILALRLGSDSPSFVDAESGSLLFLCNLFQNSCFFFEKHAVKTWGTKCEVSIGEELREEEEMVQREVRRVVGYLACLSLLL